jgi:uridine kinase
MTSAVTHIIKRNGELCSYNRDKITDAIYCAAYAVGGHDKDMSEKLAMKVETILNTTWEGGNTPSVEEINDIVEKVLIESGHATTAKSFILYRAERQHARARQSLNAPGSNSASIPYQVLYHVLNWNIEHGCDTVEKINQKIVDGTYSEFVKEVDATFESDIQAAAKQVAKRRDELKLVIIAGPSSSGKTTTTEKLAGFLRADGLELVTLNLDNYYYNLEVHPVDEYGDHDFEGPEALDLPLINKHLLDLTKGKEVQMPVFDFKTGKRTEETIPLSIKPNQLILIDSLHGLYSGMTESIDDSQKFRLYIETLSQVRGPDGTYIRWTDLRLLRRMVRDNVHRNHHPESTVGHWHYVRRAELKYIVPFINQVDFRLNSALPYELPAMKAKVFHFLPDIIKAYKGNPKKTDALLRAERVYELLESVTMLEDLDVIPKDSLLREFIGGGIYG